MRPTHAHDRRAVSSTIEAVLLVALVTVTVAGVGYAVLGLILVDDSPDVKQVKLHVSTDGVTVTPMIADPLPADDVEVSVVRASREPTGVTVRNVAGASSTRDPGRYVSVETPGPPPDGSVVSAVESNVGQDAASQGEATWAAGQPLFVGTRPGFIQQDDVLTVQVVDREHRNLLLEKKLRATALPRTLIVDVDPSPGDGGDSVPPDSSDEPSGADRSETGGVVDLGDQWELAERSVDPRARNPVVARVQRGGGGGGSDRTDVGGGDGGGTNAPRVDGPNLGPLVPPDAFGGSGDGGADGGATGDASSGSVASGQTAGSMDVDHTGETIADTIDSSQSNVIAVTNGDGGAVQMGNGMGETITVIKGETWAQANDGHATGTLPLNEFDQEIQNRVGAGLQGDNDPRAETICNCPAFGDSGGEGFEGESRTTAPSVGSSGSGEGVNAGGESIDGESNTGNSGSLWNGPDGPETSGENPSGGSSGTSNGGDNFLGDLGSDLDSIGTNGGNAGYSADFDGSNGGGSTPDVSGGNPGLDLDIGGIDLDIASIDIGSISI